MPSGHGRDYTIKAWVLAATIILLGMLLRLYHLGFQDLWYDEAFSLDTVSRSFPAMNQAIVADGAHPPLYYYFLRWWMAAFGSGVVQARLLSALFGTLSIGLTYLLARYLFDRTTGWIAALLLAISHLGFTYSQEARQYAQLQFFALAGTWLFIRALRERNPRLWWGFIACAIGMIYTHNYGWPVAGALLALAVLWRKHYHVPAWWWLGGSITVALSYVPWLLSGILFSHPNVTAVPIELTAPLTALNWFNNGKMFGARHSGTIWTLLGGAILFVVPLCIALSRLVRPRSVDSKDMDERRGLILLAILGIGLIGVIMVVSRAAHFMFHTRYVLFAVAPYYILVARGISSMNPPALRAAVILAIFAFSIPAIWTETHVSYKGESRKAYDYFLANYRDGDCAVTESSRWTHGVAPVQWKAYSAPGRPPAFDTVSSLTVRRDSCRRVWFVWSYEIWETARPDAERSKGAQLEAFYRRAARVEFSGANVSLYERTY